MNRRHNLQHALDCIKFIEKSNFDNFNLDLIFAIPTQTEEEFVADIKKLLEIKPPHISAYMLTFEEKSVFGVGLKKKMIEEQPEDFCAKCFFAVDKNLREHGYEHYEISNFARNGKFSQHNSNYWLNDKKFLGVGPAASSYNIVSRQMNVENKFVYVRSIEKNIIPSQEEILSGKDIINEFIFNNLRTSSGLNLTFLQNKYHRNIDENILKFLLEKNFLKQKSENIVLTPQGMIVSNRILEYFFVE
jgi:oxygen-independent coproporphyrinogen-3 oxidase